jgi:hypothetical protein
MTLSMISIPSTASADLSARATWGNDKLTLHLNGNADARVKDALDAIRGRMHTEALRLAVKEVTVDLTELEFMNSSCFKTFVSWLDEIGKLEPASRYTIRFISNPTILWQRRSLHALSCFAVDLVKVDSAPSR